MAPGNEVDEETEAVPGEGVVGSQGGVLVVTAEGSKSELTGHAQPWCRRGGRAEPTLRPIGPVPGRGRRPPRPTHR